MSHLKSLFCPLVASRLGVAVVSVAVSLAGCGTGGENPQAQSQESGEQPMTAIQTSPGRSPGASQLAPPSEIQPGVVPYGNPPTGGPNNAPPAVAANELVDYTVPNGTPEELFAFLQKLAQQQPRGVTQEQQLADFAKMQRARIAAASKLLSSPLDAESQIAAAQHKVDALRGLEMAGEKIGPELDKLGNTLSASADPDVAMFGKVVLYSRQFDAFANSEPKDPAALVVALKALLASQNKTPELFDAANQTAQVLAELGFRSEAIDALKATGTAFQGSENAEMAAAAGQFLAQARMFEYGIDARIQDVAEDKPNAAAQLVATVRQILANEPRNMVAMGIAQKAIQQLRSKDADQEAFQVMHAVGDAFQGNEDEQLAYMAEEFQVQARILEMGFEKHLEGLLKGEPGAADEVVKCVRETLRTEKPGESVLASVSQAADYLEMSNQIAAAGQVLDMLEQAYGNHADEEFATFAREKVAGARRRLAIVGKPFAVHGLTVDGKPFDWSKYRGKVVLVDFWATWCEPCLAEVPNIEKNYKAYRDRGFEVVSVNLNDSRADLDAWLALNKLPWPIVVSENPQAAGFKTPLAVECGIEAIPFVVLVNRNGIVEAIHVRGTELDKRLEQLLGPPGSALGGSTSASPASGDGAAARPQFDDLTVEGPQYFTALLADEADDSDASREEGDAPEERNPYLAPPGAGDAELVEFLLDMADKPRVIQERPGFPEAVVEAADRLMAMDTKPNYKRLAVLSKLRTLHRVASLGDGKADEQLVNFIGQLKDNQDAKVAVELKFLNLEREAIDCDDLPAEKIPDLLARLKEFFAAESKLDERHLRMASNTVRAINRLEDDDEREKHFAEFGKLFAASRDKQLSIYGKQLSKPVEAESELVGKPLELTGTTALGAEFNWKAYRGKVVIVDFWATWCGPCIKEMPHVKELHAKLKDKGFDVVGVSLDKDLDALAKFLEENTVPWETLSGEATQDLAQKYGVRAIPTMMLVDRDGKIVAVSHQVGSLTAKAEELLAKPAE